MYLDRVHQMSDMAYKPQRIQRRRWANAHLPVRWITLLTIFISIDSAMAQPIGTKSSGTTFNDPGFWLDPCSGSPVYPLPNDNTFLAQQLNLNIAKAYNNINWRDAYTTAKFSMSFDRKYAIDANFWLEYLHVTPGIPKKVGDTLTNDHYGLLQVENVMLHASDVLQRTGVAWEQVVLDNDASFGPNFISVRDTLKSTLCLLNMSLSTKSLSPVPDITRDIMPDTDRYPTNASYRDERTFRILKDYLNALEYFRDAFGYFASSSG